jgi:hypothetical protein
MHASSKINFLKPCFAIISSLSIALVPVATFAQEKSLSTLMHLVIEKGHRNSDLNPAVCATLNIKTSCLSFQVFYHIPGKNEYRFLFNVLRDDPNRVVLVIHNPDEGEAYATGADAQLRNALHGKKTNGKWKFWLITNSEAMKGFLAQLRFWHAKEKDMAAFPDAKQ